MTNRSGGEGLAQRRKIGDAHAPIRALVARIRDETGRPDVDPDGPGARACVLLVARDPGEKGALVTGVLSPTNNPDATARNTRRRGMRSSSAMTVEARAVAEVV